MRTIRLEYTTYIDVEIDESKCESLTDMIEAAFTEYDNKFETYNDELLANCCLDMYGTREYNQQ